MDATTSKESAFAELSSVGSQVEDLTRRVTATAEHFDKSGEEHIAHELFEVERSLRAAHRRLVRATKQAR